VIVSVQDLTVTYRGSPMPALSGITLDIAEGERLAIIGESGSGKSTFGLALAGLLPANTTMSGTVSRAGDRAPVGGRDIGMVFQDPGTSLNPVLTVGEQVAEVARRHLRLHWRDAYRRAADLLARVRLPDPEKALRAYPHQLSGGQRQRVAIAAAIAANPKLLIADEATSALDVLVQAEIAALLRELVEERGMTLLFITHDIALASTLADRIAVFRHGQLVDIGLAARVLGQPEPYTAELIGSHLDLQTPPLIDRPAA